MQHNQNSNIQLQRTGWLSLSSIIISIGLLASCSSSKISQCNELITIINRTSDNLKSIQSGGNANSQNTEQLATELGQFVTNLKQNTEAMQAVKVEESLKPLKDKLVASYQTALKNSSTLTEAIKTKNQPAAQAALNALNAASAGEAKLLQEVSNYCQAAEK